MNHRVTIVCEDNGEIEIKFNCNEDEKSMQRLTFQLHPQPSDTSVAQTETASDLSESNQQMDDEPVGFIIKIWKYKGYLIVQHSEKDFSIYQNDGPSMRSCTTLEEAYSAIDQIIIENSNCIIMSN